jgi:eukaryotic-like serine/threonine-protein kinase
MESQKFGRYEVMSELGRGAMGVVYKAADPVLNRVVAVKTINLLLADDEREEYEARFYQEAKAAGGLSHPNIVTIYDLGNTGDTAYMAMEFLEGRELRDLIGENQPLPIRKSLAIAAQVADGLAYAHERGIVHRDIKPANIMILSGDLAKLTDFGIARMRTSEVKTQTGMRLGSPKYMSPEQVIGKRTDHRSDIFSLGIVLYEMLTGRAPFSGGNLEALMYQTIHFVPPPPSRINPDIPEMLDLIIAKMLEKSTDDRYQATREVASDLRECEKHYGSESVLGRTGNAAMATGLHDLPPGLAADFGPTADVTAVKDLRDADTEKIAGVGALGISTVFDSFEATQRLAKEVGMAREFDEFSATTRFARTVRSPAVEATMRVASITQNIPMKPSGWSGKEKLFASSLLLIAILVAALIIFY